MMYDLGVLSGDGVVVRGLALPPETAFTREPAATAACAQERGRPVGRYTEPGRHVAACSSGLTGSFTVRQRHRAGSGRLSTVTANGEQGIPTDFDAFASSPFFAAVGPAWIRNDMPPTIGIRIEPRHCNSGGTAHGGLLVALADLALGQGIRAVAGTNVRLVTAGLSADFARPIAVGQWVEAQADIQHQSHRTVFANCYLTSNGHRAVRVSGIYTIVGG
jgi:acyl-coenzyme A thioesterase 13